jgi:hypothetical protein
MGYTIVFGGDIASKNMLASLVVPAKGDEGRSPPEGSGEVDMRDFEPLFGRFSLRDILLHREEVELKLIIERLDENRLLNASVTDLVDYFFNELQIIPIQVFTEKIAVDQKEINIDVSQDQNRLIMDRSVPFYIKGTQIIYFLPYHGDMNLLYASPSHSSTSRPRANVTDKDLQFVFEILDHNGEAVKSDFERQLKNLMQYLEWSKQEIDHFNSQLPPKVQSFVEARKQKLLNDRGLVASLGFPMRKRDDAPDTFAVPIVRKKIVTLPPVSTAPYAPEPALAMEEYDQILTIISNMVMVMERSPSEFHDIQEEGLRSHFIVQLNGQYEGQATGETFNNKGKTDILIRVNDKNIFIAECKFWKGEKVFLDTINQLLSYACWRDTKTAILVFNRNKKFSGVISAIPEIAKKHPNYKKQLTYNSETNSRYVFHHNDDPNRELLITVMIFDIPGNE